MNTTSTNKTKTAKRKTARWMDLAAIGLVLGLAYLAMTLTLGNFKPIGAVVSGSMEPFLSRGDLVILKRVAPADLRVGDVAQVEIPRSFQEKFGLPPNTLHRIVDIRQTGNNVQFITKGDNNPDIDPIPVAPDRVGGIVVAHVPYAGHLFLFLNSPQGRIFALVMAISVGAYITYIFILDNWRNVVVAAQTGAGTLPPGVAPLDADTTAPGAPEAGVVTVAQPPGTGVPGALPPGIQAGIQASVQGPAGPISATDLRLVSAVTDERFDEIESGIHETRDSLRHFSAAIAEYGTHLQSHTATVRDMSDASRSLVQAVHRQNEVLAQLSDMLDGNDVGPAPARRTRRPRRRAAGDGPGTRRPAAGVADARRTTARKPTLGASAFRQTLRTVSARRDDPRRPRK